jgi:hypothetical protein
LWFALLCIWDDDLGSCLNLEAVFLSSLWYYGMTSFLCSSFFSDFSDKTLKNRENIMAVEHRDHLGM